MKNKSQYWMNELIKLRDGKYSHVEPRSEDDSFIDGKVYKITNKLNGKVYIGVTVLKPSSRIKQHMSLCGGSPKLRRAIIKYTPENFKWHIIDLAHSVTDLNTKEIFWINFFKSCNPRYGYNILSGGFTNEFASKKRMVAITEVGTGKDFNSIKEASLFFGIPATQISCQLRGKQPTVHGRVFIYKDKNKRDKVQKYKEDKRIRSSHSVIFKCIETGELFYNIKQAVDKYKVSRVTITKNLKGIKTNMGINLTYLDEKRAYQRITRVQTGELNDSK